MRLLAAITAVALCACLPNPQSVKERREGFDRDSLRGKLILDQLPSDARKVGAVFGNRIELAAVRTDPPNPKRGDKVQVTFFWTAKKPVNEDYMVFVHGDAIGGNARRIHGDHWPAKGKYPTDVWRSGEYVVDTFQMDISADYGAPKLGVYTGLYKGNYRVPRTDKGAVYGDNENRTRPLEIAF